MKANVMRIVVSVGRKTLVLLLFEAWKSWNWLFYDKGEGVSC